MENEEKYLKGRGSQLNTANRFLKQEYVQEHIEALDEEFLGDERTKLFFEYPKKIVNKVDSPDIYAAYSLNPYQGCEHGCIYCYARNSHEYWGFSAGLDFERKIIVKPDAPKLLREQFDKKSWQPHPIMVSGNTDCYQPIERQFKLTRQLLEVFLEYRHPLGMITKNSLILRDTDLLSELAKHKLVHVMVSITSLREDIRLKMEPRTASAKKRMNVLNQLSKAGIPCGVMTAPIIPGLTSMEIPSIIKQAADNGAVNAGYTIVRLNGAIGTLFTDWVNKNFPDAAQKILNQIAECHGGQLNDSRYGTRMRGEGKIAESIRQIFVNSVKRYLKGRHSEDFNTRDFRRPGEATQLALF